MDFQPFNKIPRLSREMVVTEKIDGTNGIIAIWHYFEVTDSHPGMIEVESGGEKYVILAGSRTRWISTIEDNYGFARWVKDHAQELVKLGPGVHYGEWWGFGIQRGYGLKEKRFSLFNTARWSDDSVRPVCCGVVPVLYTGVFDTLTVSEIIFSLKTIGSKAAPGFMNPEGVIIFHSASSKLFKKTIEGDEKPKGSKE